MSRPSRFPWLAVAIGAGLVYLFTRPAKAEPIVWRAKPDHWMVTGGHYRWSVQRYGGMTAVAIAAELAHEGFTAIRVWQNEWPADWPSEDRDADRNRIEVTATAPTWIGAPVRVWSATPFSEESAPPADPTRGNRLALLAQGTMRP